MAVDLFANAANTTLAAGIAAGAATLTVASSTPFPAVTTAAGTQFRVIIDAELFIVTNVTGLAWTVTPGAEGTTQAVHANGAPVTALATAAALATKSYLVESVNTVATSGATQTIPDVTVATSSRIVLTAACTFTFPTLAAGKSFTLVLVQDATGGRTAVWPASVLWSGGTAPTLTATANKRDVLTFVAVDATNWLGFTAGLNF